MEYIQTTKENFMEWKGLCELYTKNDVISMPSKTKIGTRVCALFTEKTEKSAGPAA